MFKVKADHNSLQFFLEQKQLEERHRAFFIFWPINIIVKNITR